MGVGKERERNSGLNKVTSFLNYELTVPDKFRMENCPSLPGSGGRFL